MYGDGLTHGSGCCGSGAEDDCLRWGAEEPQKMSRHARESVPHASHGNGNAPHASHENGNAPHANHGSAVLHRLDRLSAESQLSPGLNQPWQVRCQMRERWEQGLP